MMPEDESPLALPGFQRLGSRWQIITARFLTAPHMTACDPHYVKTTPHWQSAFISIEPQRNLNKSENAFTEDSGGE